MNILISIFGPTAVGKTSFALKLASQAVQLKNEHGNKIFTGVDIISADSRQIYQGLEVLTGTDIPLGFEKTFPNNKDTKEKSLYPFFRKDKINFYGVSIIGLTEEWSLSHFKNFATKIIMNSLALNRLPIIVGGTGLYINHLFKKDNKLFIPPSDEIREKAKSMSLQEMQEWLKEVNLNKFLLMNNSDKNNPRRLIRAIELSLGIPNDEEICSLPENLLKLRFGLTSDLEIILEKISQRVADRFNAGVIKEVEKVNKICRQNNLPVCSTLGIKDLTAYIKNEINLEKCLKLWALHEFQYSKRQLVWLKKEKEVIWLDDLTKSSYTLVDEKIFI